MDHFHPPPYTPHRLIHPPPPPHRIGPAGLTFGVQGSGFRARGLGFMGPDYSMTSEIRTADPQRTLAPNPSTLNCKPPWTALCHGTLSLSDFSRGRIGTKNARSPATPGRNLLVKGVRTARLCMAVLWLCTRLSDFSGWLILSQTQCLKSRVAKVNSRTNPSTCPLY